MKAKADTRENELVIHNLRKRYGNGVQALNGVHLTLSNGMFGLLGPNGSGKSTLMRTLATLQEADSGWVRFNGQDIHKQPEDLRARLGYLPQDFGVFPKARARQLLSYIATLKGLPLKGNRQIDELLEVTNLSKHQHRRLSTFSGGMLRRFGIAQALLGSPRLLIVDEPTAGLDPEERHRFHNLLCQVAEKMVVILSTHLVEDVRHLCPEMAILKDGEIKFTGQPNQLAMSIKGRVWTAPESDATPLKQGFRLTTHVRHGRKWVRVYTETQPGPEYLPCEPKVEDGYFYALRAEEVAHA